MKMKVLVLGLLLFLISGCNMSGKSEKNETSQKEKNISLVKDSQTNSNRVWLLVNSPYSKDSFIRMALRVNNGRAEMINFSELVENADDVETPSNSLRTLDKIDDDKIWQHLLKIAEVDYNKTKSSRIKHAEEQINFAKGNISDMDRSGTEFGGLTHESENAKIKSYEDLIDTLNSNDKYKSYKNRKITSQVETDNTGNKVISEIFSIGKENIIYKNDSDGSHVSDPFENYLNLPSTYIPTGDNTILSREYSGYQSEDESLITRVKNQTIDFDTPKIKNVFEK